MFDKFFSSEYYGKFKRILVFSGAAHSILVKYINVISPFISQFMLKKIRPRLDKFFFIE